MPDFQTYIEEIKVKGHELVDKVKDALHEGNVRRIIVKDDKGTTYLEIPLAVGVVAVIAAPVLAAIGALAALAANFTLVIERGGEAPKA